jgi:hypothetical protein
MFGLEIVSINVWEHVNPRYEAERFQRIHKMDGAILMDEQGDYASRVGLPGVPWNIIVNKKGIVQAVGTTTPDEVRATLTKLLNPFGGKAPAS